MKLYTTQNCGIKELDDLKYPFRSAQEKISAIYGRYLDPKKEVTKCSIITFSDRIVSPYGKALASYITENNLGEVIQTPIVRNPNSGNKIILYVWIINMKALKSWIKDNPYKERETTGWNADPIEDFEEEDEDEEVEW